MHQIRLRDAAGQVHREDRRGRRHQPVVSAAARLRGSWRRLHHRATRRAACHVHTHANRRADACAPCSDICEMLFCPPRSAALRWRVRPLALLVLPGCLCCPAGRPGPRALAIHPSRAASQSPACARLHGCWCRCRPVEPPLCRRRWSPLLQCCAAWRSSTSQTTCPLKPGAARPSTWRHRGGRGCGQRCGPAPAARRDCWSAVHGMGAAGLLAAVADPFCYAPVCCCCSLLQLVWVLLIAGFVWLKRHRRECRLRAEQAQGARTGLPAPLASWA